MASCDVHVTPPVENGKDEPDNDENRTNANGIRNTQNGTVPKTSKIPVLVRLDSNDSFTYTSTRKYSTLRTAIKTRTKLDKTFSSTSTLIYTGDDSGVQMDSSMLEDDYFRPGVLISKTNSSTPRSHRSTETLMALSESEQELGTAEQLTLRVLQRAVAEMEADVALHADMLEDEMNFKLEQQLNSELELQSLRDINETLVQEEETEQAEKPLQEEPQQQIPEELDEDVSEEQTEELLRELSEELALELSEDLALELSEELPEKLSQELSEELAEELIKELPELPLELSEEAMINISEELPNIVSSELHKQHQLEDLHLELLERLAMKIEISEMPEIALPKLEEELPKKPLEQLPQEPSEQQVMELSAELAEKLSRELLEKLPVQSVSLEQPIQSFPTRISTPRKHVRVEQLLEAENDIQMLKKLLSNDEPDLLLQPEDEPVPVDQNENNDFEDLPLIPHNTTDDWNKNDLNLLESLMTFFCGKGIRKLGYPILLCGMAVGLIYYFRKD